MSHIIMENQYLRKNGKNNVGQQRFSKNNHYVPRMYLKHWATDNKIYVYNLLVSNENVPMWQLQSISRTASMNKMYVRMESDSEIDDFETYFSQSFEDPAASPFEKLCKGEKLNSHEWVIIKDYITAQYVRTTSFYIKTQDVNRGILEKEIDNALHKLSTGDIDPDNNHKADANIGVDMSLLPLSISIIKGEDRNSQSFVSVESVAGKSTWLMAIKRYLSDDSCIRKWMRQLHWAVVDCPEDTYWPTTDTPLVIINPRIPQESFIGVAEADNIFIFPISPTKVLIAKNGKRLDYGLGVSYKQAIVIKQAIVNNALLYIYSENEDPEIVNMRERLVSESEYKRVHDSLDRWHERYLEKEVPLLQSNVSGE